jgi:DNA polymerase IV
VARRLRRHGLKARTVTLKYRDEAFRTLTRAETLAAPTDHGNQLFAVAWRLFEDVHGPRKVRLLGIYASGLGGGTAQLDLFAPPPSPVDQAQDQVRERFGDGALTRASLLGRRERRNPSDRIPD